MPLDEHAAADQSIGQKFKLTRSPEWPEVEKQFKSANPKCTACDETSQLNVHHKRPFHFVVLCGRPDLELDPRNLITLCTRTDREHHLLLGHLDDYESYNPAVLQFVNTYTGKTNQEIRRDGAFQKAQTEKPRHLEQMTASDRTAFKQMLDQQFA